MKKKTLIYAAAFALATATLTSADYATAKTDNDKVHNVNSKVQFPSNRWRLVKHAFLLHIPQKHSALSQLIIGVPSTVAVSKDINVLDNNGKKININVSTNGRNIIIFFPEPVISKTKILIELNKVKQPILDSTSVYSLSAKVVGSDIEIPVGVVRFPMF